MPSITELSDELNCGRPVIAGIEWSNGKQHWIVIVNIRNNILFICDPANGDSVIHYDNFPDTYLGGATIQTVIFTKSL